VTLSAFNVQSPYGVIREYRPIEFKGFFLHPKSDSAPEGWTYTPGAEPPQSKPGEAGGSAPYRFIGKPPTRPWVCYHTPGTFLYGEVDWRGRWKDTDKLHRGRYRLSYHGPASRYFVDPEFSYGSSDTHNNIYEEGRCIAVAPFPVLGACLRLMQDAHHLAMGGIDPPMIWYVIAVCKDGNRDVVLRKPRRAGVLGPDYTDEFRAASMRMYDKDEAPDGWLELGSATLSTATQGTNCAVNIAKTPWFFNSEGTQAACVRECEFDMDGGAAIGTVRRSGYNVFTMNVSEHYASFADLRNDPGYGYTLTVKTSKEDELRVVTKWPYTTSRPALEHSWDVYVVDLELRCLGEYTVGVDYRDNTFVRLRVKSDIKRTQKQNMYFGTDPIPHPESALAGDSNAGDKYGDIYNYEGPDRGELSGATEQWAAVNDKVFLDFSGDGTDTHWLYRRFSGSRTEFMTGVSDPEDQNLYYVWKLNTYPHHVDVRTPHIISYVEEDVMQMLAYPAPVAHYESEQHYYIGEGNDYKKIMERRIEDTFASAGGEATGIGRGWLFSDVVDGRYTIGTTTTVSFKDVDIPIPLELDYDWPENVPSLSESYYNQIYSLGDGMYPLRDMLQSIAKNVRVGGYGVDDFENAAVSMQYVDHEYQTKQYNFLTGGDLGSVTSADGENQRFYKLGVS